MDNSNYLQAAYLLSYISYFTTFHTRILYLNFLYLLPNLQAGFNFPRSQLWSYSVLFNLFNFSYFFSRFSFIGTLSRHASRLCAILYTNWLIFKVFLWLNALQGSTEFGSVSLATTEDGCQPLSGCHHLSGLWEFSQLQFCKKTNWTFQSGIFCNILDLHRELTWLKWHWW